MNNETHQGERIVEISLKFSIVIKSMRQSFLCDYAAGKLAFLLEWFRYHPSSDMRFTEQKPGLENGCGAFDLGAPKLSASTNKQSTVLC
ncbi:MAG: hypothetical protein RBR02_09945 [Desulfuromonadaceae bacterium]|nr:hypothetical protein [Desulfuromonadaceae bacterium]